MNEELREFLCAVEDLNLDLVRQLWNPSINISANDDWAYRYACERGHLELVQQLHEWNLTIVDSASYDKALENACRSGNPDLVRQLIEWKPTIVNSAGYGDAFIMACGSGNDEIVRLLYQKKRWFFFNVFKNAFIAASEKGHLEIVILLYGWESGIVNPRKPPYGKEFTAACCSENPDLVRQLIKWTPTIVNSACYEDAFGKACRSYEHKLKLSLRYGVSRPTPEVVRLLIQLKPTIDLSRFIEYKSLLKSLGIPFLSLLRNFQRESIPEGDIFECPVCFETEKRDRLVTPCGHKFCEDCVEKLYEPSLEEEEVVPPQPTCPYCRQNL